MTQTHPPAGPTTPTPPPGPKQGATALLPRLGDPKPSLPPGAPHPDAPAGPPKPGRVTASQALLVIGAGLFLLATAWVVPVAVGGGW